MMSTGWLGGKPYVQLRRLPTVLIMLIFIVISLSDLCKVARLMFSTVSCLNHEAGWIAIFYCALCFFPFSALSFLATEGRKTRIFSDMVLILLT